MTFVRISDKRNSPGHLHNNKPKSLYSVALFTADIFIAEKLIMMSVLPEVSQKGMSARQDARHQCLATRAPEWNRVKVNK